MNKKNVLDLVKEYLEKDARYRDNDKLLTASIWFYEAGNKNMNMIEFLKLYADGKLSDAETIIMAKREIQETYPHLR